MMSRIIYGVLAIGKIRPYRIRQELVLGIAWPVLETRCMPLVLTDHFLQKNNICIQGTQVVTQVMHHHAPVEMRKTLMNIVGCNVQSVGHTVRGKDPDQEAARKKGRRADG